MGDWYDKHFSSSFGAERSSSVKAKPSRRQAALLAAQPIKATPSGPMQRYNALDAESKTDVLAYGLLTFAVGALGATIINRSMTKRIMTKVRFEGRTRGWSEGYDEGHREGVLEEKYQRSHAQLVNAYRIMGEYRPEYDDARPTIPNPDITPGAFEYAQLIGEGWHDEPDPNPMYARQHNIKHGLWRPL